MRSVQENKFRNPVPTAPTPAPAVPAESALADDGQDDWSANKIVYTVDPAEDGSYTVEQESTIAVESITDIYGQPVTDYTVAYFQGASVDDAVLTDDSSDATLDKRDGGMPGAIANDYYIVVFRGSVDLSKATGGTTKIGDLASAGEYTAQAFSVVKKAKSIEGAYAFEYAAGDKSELSDRSWQYTGVGLNAAFAVGSEVLTAGTDYTIKWVDLPAGADVPAMDGATSTDDDDSAYTKDILHAGAYTAELTGTGDWKGTAEVTFQVNGINLKADSIAFTPVEADGSSKGLTLDTSDKVSLQATDYVKLSVNGVALNASTPISVKLVSATDAEGADINLTTANTYYEPGKYTFEVTPGANAGNDVTGSKATVVAYLVSKVVTYTYTGIGTISNGQDLGTFNPEMNNAFDPGKITASEGGYTYVVKDAEGTQVNAWDEPGEYTVVLDTPLATDYSRVGHVEATFTVVNNVKEYPQPLRLYVSVDGKAMTSVSHSVEYDKEAVTPLVAVTSDGNKLAEGEDYAVAYKLGDEAVAEIKDPGDYTVVVTLNDGLDPQTELTQAIAVDKADVNSAKPAAEFFATDGETAAAPSFVGYSLAGFKGVEFELPADQISVKYYTNYVDALDDQGQPGTDGVKDTLTGEVAAEDLTEAGDYWAQINIMTNATYVENAVGVDLVVPFQVLETAVFADVAADAWYAEYVYKASNEGYMNGVAKGIFAPEQPMQRSEFARVVFNMAGNTPNQTDGVVFPTQFTDVPENAWYAEAVEWAARYNIVTGTSATTFDPTGTITREQIATMLYRYAGNGAQADLTVLDQFSDADQISEYAKNAMAWAVEEGYMNGKGENNLDPQGTALRCEIAKLAVMVQPEAL